MAINSQIRREIWLERIKDDKWLAEKLISGS